MSRLNLLEKIDNDNDIRMSLEVEFKKLFSKVEVPQISTFGSAGFDIHVYPELDYENPEDPNTPTEKIIQPGELYMCHTGIATSFKPYWAALIYNRSGMATKKRLCLPAGVYVIDSDYRGEWTIPIINNSNTPQVIKSGDRVAQILFHMVAYPLFNETDKLDETTRGTGGFGSTGV